MVPHSYTSNKANESAPFIPIAELSPTTYLHRLSILGFTINIDVGSISLVIFPFFPLSWFPVSTVLAMADLVFSEVIMVPLFSIRFLPLIRLLSTETDHCGTAWLFRLFSFRGPVTQAVEELDLLQSFVCWLSDLVGLKVFSSSRKHL